MRDKVNDGARLSLMLESIANIAGFMEGVESLEEFKSDKMLCHAVVYNLQCIGEGAYMLSKDFVAAHNDMNWAAIAGLRHVLVHDYYQVDFETVWWVVQKDLAPLKESAKYVVSNNYTYPCTFKYRQCRIRTLRLHPL